MSVKRGIYRIAQAVKWTGRGLVGLWFMVGGFVMLTSPVSERSQDELVYLILVVVFLAITEGIAWILEGFGSD
jgi:hypothetical protein